MRKYDYLEPDILARIRKRKFVIGRIRSGRAGGLHLSSMKGSGSEYIEHRLYQPGDDIKRIDWRLSARRENLYFRENDEDSNCAVYMVLDGTGSMDFTSSETLHTKFSYAKRLISHLFFFFNGRKDSAFPIFMNGSGFVNISGRVSHNPASVIPLLRNWTASGAMALPVQLRKAARTFRKQGLVIIFSDFIDPFFSDDGITTLLRERGRKILLVHLMDPAEMEFPFRKFHKFIDPENSDFQTLDSGKVRRRYLEALSVHRQLIGNWCRKEGAGLVPVCTDLPLELALDSILQTSGRRV